MPKSVDKVEAESVDKAITEVSSRVEESRQKLEEVNIENDQDLQEASDFLVSLKKRHKGIDKLRKEFTQPLLKQKRAIHNRFKEQLEPLQEAIDSVKSAIGSYQKKKRQEAKKEQERLRKQKERKNEKREEKGQSKDLTPDPVVEKPSQTTRSESGGKTVTRKKWDYEVEDKNKMPREYLKPDKGALRKAVRDGVREIEGVRIYEDEQVSVYTN